MGQFAHLDDDKQQAAVLGVLLHDDDIESVSPEDLEAALASQELPFTEDDRRAMSGAFAQLVADGLLEVVEGQFRATQVATRTALLVLE